LIPRPRRPSPERNGTATKSYRNKTISNISMVSTKGYEQPTEIHIGRKRRRASPERSPIFVPSNRTEAKAHTERKDFISH
jgi:hypothetical protein